MYSWPLEGFWGPHSEQLGVTNQNDLVESHVQTSRDSDDSDDNVCVCAFVWM